MRLGFLLLAVVLAGCSEAPPPVVAGEATLREGPHFDHEQLAPLGWHTLQSETILLASALPHSTSASVPPGTLAVYVNLTPEAGAALGLVVSMGACSWARDFVMIGPSPAFGADCGGLSEGAHDLRLDTRAGAVRAKLDVVALVCAPYPGASRCPAPAPVP